MYMKRQMIDGTHERDRHRHEDDRLGDLLELGVVGEDGDGETETGGDRR
jgi:hypothetical protein